MHRSKLQYLLVLSLTSFCYCKVSKVLENKLVDGFVDYNSQPGQIYSRDEGYLQNAQRSVPTSGKQLMAVVPNKSRAKRQGTTGGQSEQDPSKPEYKALAEESMQKYLATRGNIIPHKVVDVTHVTTQVVSGIITRIDFIISPVVGTTGDVQSCHSEIWEQDWLKKKEIKVNCGIVNNSRAKRLSGLCGAPELRDPSKPEYKALAEESMQKYLATSGNIIPHKVVDVTHVTTQLVSGIITRIDFIISPVVGTTGDVQSCHSEIWEQDWLKKKEIKVNCGIENNSRAKRLSGLCGAPELRDPSKPEYKALAEESMQKYLATSGNIIPHKVVDVTHVTTQLVSGIITRIDFIISPVVGTTGDVQSCHSEIWEQDWLKKKEIKVNCGIENNSRAKRLCGLCGAPELRDPTKPEYKALAEESMQKYLATSGNIIPHKVVDVTHVTTQLVSGIITRIDFIISPVVGTTGDVQSCHSEIWEQDWLNKKEIKVNCGLENNSRAKRQLLGAEKLEDPSKPEYRALAMESMQKYLANEGITLRYVISSITRVTTAIVSGIITRIDFKISPVRGFTGDVRSCHSEIWEQDWLNKKKIEVNCKPMDRYIPKRLYQKVGGQTLQDPSEPEYKALAKESMQKYLAPRGITGLYKVDLVTRVTTQVVSGVITRIDFQISPVRGATGPVKNCHSEILEQPWLNNKDIQVNCANAYSGSSGRYKRELMPGALSELYPIIPEYKTTI